LKRKIIHPLKNNFVFFLISPFLGFIQAFKYYKEDWAKNSVWLFVIFYGYTMYRPEIMDSTRYVINLINLYNTPISWDVFVKNFYSDDSDTVDLYQPLITFILSRFTKDGNILFAVFGVVYGYFYSRNIWLVIDLAKGKKVDRTFWVLVIAFICVLGFWNLNGVRMWTAAHVFFYGGFQYLVNNKRKSILIAASSVLIHFSFVLPVAALILFAFVKIPWRILYFLFIGSFSLSTLNIAAVRTKFESIAPAFLLPRVDRYTNDEYVEAVSDLNESAVWYIKYYTNSLMWFIVILFTIIYFKNSKTNKDSKSFSNLFGFSLLILAIGNITSLLPSGGRFVLVAQLFGVALLIYCYTQFDDFMYKRWLTLIIPMLYFFILISMRISFDTISFMTIFSNPILASFVDLPIPLIDLFK
jgi:EpsG family